MPTMLDKCGYISLTKLSLWLRNFLAAGQKQKYKYNSSSTFSSSGNFSLINSSLNNSQDHAPGDYIRACVMLQYNKRWWDKKLHWLKNDEQYVYRFWGTNLGETCNDTMFDNWFTKIMGCSHQISNQLLFVLCLPRCSAFILLKIK